MNAEHRVTSRSHSCDCIVFNVGGNLLQGSWLKIEALRHVEDQHFPRRPFFKALDDLGTVLWKQGVFEDSLEILGTNPDFFPDFYMLRCFDGGFCSWSDLRIPVISWSLPTNHPPINQRSSSAIGWAIKNAKLRWARIFPPSSTWWGFQPIMNPGERSPESCWFITAWLLVRDLLANLYNLLNLNSLIPIMFFIDFSKKHKHWMCLKMWSQPTPTYLGSLQ